MPRHRLLIGLAVTLGVVLIALAIGILTVWELTFFRLTTIDHDFTDLVCGSPWNNPGWETGTPCHGTVNRQTAFGLAGLVDGSMRRGGDDVSALATSLDQGQHLASLRVGSASQFRVPVNPIDTSPKEVKPTGWGVFAVSPPDPLPQVAESECGRRLLEPDLQLVSDSPTLELEQFQIARCSPGQISDTMPTAIAVGHTTTRRRLTLSTQPRNDALVESSLNQAISNPN